jgi:restriction endonuclease S subunit
MRLSDVAEITHGTILSRVTDPLKLEKNKRLMVTMQDLSYYCGDHLELPEKTFYKINPENLTKCLFGKVNDVLIGLTVNKAMIINEDFNNALIPSNFALIRLKSKTIDPYYFVWYINESNDYKKQSEQISQGSIIRSLSIKELRDISCNFPSMEKQRKIGKIYQLIQVKEKLERKQKEYSIAFLKGIEETKGEY